MLNCPLCLKKFNKARDLKTHFEASHASKLGSFGVKPILEKLVDDVKELETTGISIKGDDGKTYEFYASLGPITADNLGRHAVHTWLCSGFHCQFPLLYLQYSKRTAANKANGKGLAIILGRHFIIKAEAASTCFANVV